MIVGRMMFELINLFKEYEGKTVLDDISFTVNQGEVVGIVGKSGSGKTTLLRLLNLLEEASAGQLLLDAKNVSSMSRREVQEAKQNIGVVFQHYNLLHNLTVLDNVNLPLKLIGSSDYKKAEILLSFVGLKDKMNTYPAKLSGGERQRVAIARALIRDPEIILCDEATSSLDEENTYDIIRLLQKVHKESQATIIFVSHELETVKSFCQRILVVEDGHLIGDLENNPKEIEELDKSYLDKVKRSMNS